MITKMYMSAKKNKIFTAKDTHYNYKYSNLTKLN